MWICEFDWLFHCFLSADRKQLWIANENRSSINFDQSRSFMYMTDKNRFEKKNNRVATICRNLWPRNWIFNWRAVPEKNENSNKIWNEKFFNGKIHRGYYMAARGYEFYLRVLKKYLTSERSERVRYFQHEKIKFVSPSGHVIFCLLYKIIHMKWIKFIFSKKLYFQMPFWYKEIAVNWPNQKPYKS